MALQGASVALEEELVLASLGKTGATVTVPTKLWVALCEVEQDRTVKCNSLKEELTYEGYARGEIETIGTEFTWTIGTASTKGKWTQNKLIKFKLNINTTGKNAAKYFAICTEVGAGAGKVQYIGKLTEELIIVKAMTEVTIPASGLEITAE